jgi:hypothetical protein
MSSSNIGPEIEELFDVLGDWSRCATDRRQFKANYLSVDEPSFIHSLTAINLEHREEGNWQ